MYLLDAGRNNFHGSYERKHKRTVAHERSQPNSWKRVLIPDVCIAMGVDTLDTFQMLHQTRAQFHLQ